MSDITIPKMDALLNNANMNADMNQMDGYIPKMDAHMGGNITQDANMNADVNQMDADVIPKMDGDLPKMDAVGGTGLGALLAPKIMTPIVLTVASIAAAKRLRRMTSAKQSRKMRGGTALGTVAVPATLVVANHLVPALFGKNTRKSNGGARRQTRRSRRH